jgi:hypothetical protein
MLFENPVPTGCSWLALKAAKILLVYVKIIFVFRRKE